METIELDIRGQVCPSSLLLALREINKHYKEISAGALRVIILTDNRDATGTIPNAAQNMGISAEIDKIKGFYRIILCQKT